jgi:3-methyladenine DNA glycosylase/8-oxoguanine DNA glycosylase
LDDWRFFVSLAGRDSDLVARRFVSRGGFVTLFEFPVSSSVTDVAAQRTLRRRCELQGTNA